MQRERTRPERRFRTSIRLGYITIKLVSGMRVHQDSIPKAAASV